MAGTGDAHLRPAAEHLLAVEDLTVEFNAGGGRRVHAVSGISLDVARGETLGLVGESGCGKSTLGRAILQLPAPTAGQVVFDGIDLTSLSRPELRLVRPRLQMIFQDPISSLNPRRTLAAIVEDPLVAWRRGSAVERRRVMREMLERVGLNPDVAAVARPHQFSGGQCQRACIARALVLQPDLIICDEPVSSLDVSIQAQVINLLEDLRVEYGLTLIFVAHDLAVVKSISDRIAVMYLGKLCEVGASALVYGQPAHPYTAALLNAAPTLQRRKSNGTAHKLPAEIPSPIDPPSGCRFRTRCPRAADRCAAEEPRFRQVNGDHWVACHFPLVEPTRRSQERVVSLPQPAQTQSRPIGQRTES